MTDVNGLVNQVVRLADSDAEELADLAGQLRAELLDVDSASVGLLPLASQAQGAASTIVSPQSYPTVASTIGAAFGPVAAAAKANGSATNQYSPFGQTTQQPNAGPVSPNGSAVITP